jgi:chemotaxis regulatin CheY-phosphate phosphatase CheZ
MGLRPDAMIYQLIAVAALVSIVGVGGYFKGKRDEAVGWAVAVAEQDAEIQRFKDDSAARLAVAAQAAKKSISQLAAARAAAEKERANAASVHANWNAYFDRMQRDKGDGETNTTVSLAACRADAAAARGALSTVLAAALNIREVAVANTDVLKALQEWVRQNGKTD